jgi:DNA replicative helicase MCM subunit Mcm2 (Cdc46/Mcm family)
VRPRQEPRDNIDIPPTLLSRFDLIYLVLDASNAAANRRLAKHIVSLFYRNDKEMWEADVAFDPDGGGDDVYDALNRVDANDDDTAPEYAPEGVVRKCWIPRL